MRANIHEEWNAQRFHGSLEVACLIALILRKFAVIELDFCMLSVTKPHEALMWDWLGTYVNPNANKHITNTLFLMETLRCNKNGMGRSRVIKSVIT